MGDKLTRRIQQSINKPDKKITLQNGLNFFTQAHKSGRYTLICFRDSEKGPSLQEAQTMANHVEKAMKDISGVEIISGTKTAKDGNSTFDVYELHWSKKVGLL